MFINIIFDKVFNKLYSCFLTGFLLFSPPRDQSRNVTPHFRIFCYSLVYFLLRMHLYSDYYYYDYEIIGVLRLSWFAEILF